MTDPATDFARGPVLRVVNYHNTPFARAGQYDREFAALAGRFKPVRESDLDEWLDTGCWPHDRPGVIPAFYNGYRNNFDVARPLLERHGLVGWFFAVTAYTSCPANDQPAFTSTRTLATVDGEYDDPRTALSWDELRALDGPHVVASHTRNHTRVALDDAARLEDEIVGAQEDFRRELGHPVRSFAWLFGGRYGENPMADAAVGRAGYSFLFSNFNVQRLPKPRR
ncbi:MAG: polysaccharide deacetylase family protein [Defluviimonas sp.]|uniref:polysaccharide deacetylase family protein n=1 Tax=Albidovulum sp. TaxID=1872424 RepID=UPI002A333659|nr:polysaccharide deacetylase family protein [Defluviimonas sp.]